MTTMSGVKLHVQIYQTWRMHGSKAAESSKRSRHTVSSGDVPQIARQKCCCFQLNFDFYVAWVDLCTNLSYQLPAAVAGSGPCWKVGPEKTKHRVVEVDCFSQMPKTASVVWDRNPCLNPGVNARRIFCSNVSWELPVRRLSRQFVIWAGLFHACDDHLLETDKSRLPLASSCRTRVLNMVQQTPEMSYGNVGSTMSRATFWTFCVLFCTHCYIL